MLSSKSLAIVLGLVLVCASGVRATPIFDGNVDAANYAEVEADATGEANFGGSVWDITQAAFDRDNSYFYIGLDVDNTDPPPADKFDVNGQDLLPPVTQVLILLDDGAISKLFTLLLSDAPGWPTQALYLNGTEQTTGWAVATDNDLELKLDNNLLNSGFDYENFFFQCRLDNSGASPDDTMSAQVTGVPEPATLALVAFGGLALLRRRRS